MFLFASKVPANFLSNPGYKNSDTAGVDRRGEQAATDRAVGSPPGKVWKEMSPY